MSDSQQDRDQGMVDQLKGKVKETVGDVTGDNSTKYGGKLDQAKGKAREGLADAKDRLDDRQTDDDYR